MERLQKIIAARGLCSRRQAEQWIEDGRVMLNGAVATLGQTADADTDEILVDGKPLPGAGKKVYLMLNKPRGYTTIHADKHAEHLAIELIDCPEAQRLIPAGRLDKDSEGLLIFSNDGNFIQKITHPRYNVTKQYKVTASRELDEKNRKKMVAGIMDEGEQLKALKVTPVPDEKSCYYIELNEGKKREIRRMLKACGAATLRLQRIAMGSVKLNSLAVGKWRKLTAEEVASLLAAAEKIN